MMNGMRWLPVLAAAAALAASVAPGMPLEGAMDVVIERHECRSADGVNIVYSAAGAGEPALVFVHGGMADRTFWNAQLHAFAGKHRVIALDLAGHGESGTVRPKWGFPEFGADVRTVVEAEKVDKVILFGNSLGGPVAIEAALQMPGKVLGVVGVDTFQSVSYTIPADGALARAEAFRKDFAGSVKEMTKALFHPDADPALVADAEKRMAKTSPEPMVEMFKAMGGYDHAAPVRRLAVPLRAINGDLYPTDITGVRKVKADFDAVIMKHMGHYPMLERPDEFNGHVANVVAELVRLAGTA